MGSENLTDGLTGRRIATGSENRPRDASRLAQRWSRRRLRPLACTCVRGVGGMMDEGSVGGSRTLAPLIYPHMRLRVGGGGATAGAFSRARRKREVFFPPLLLNQQRFSCTSGGVGLDGNFPLSDEYNSSRFTKVLILIHRYSGIHLLNIQSDTF